MPQKAQSKLSTLQYLIGYDIFTLAERTNTYFKMGLIFSSYKTRCHVCD